MKEFFFPNLLILADYGVGNGNQLQDSYLENSTDSAGGDTIEQHMHAWFFGYFLRLQVDKRCPSM